MKGFTILVSAVFVLLGVSASSGAKWTAPLPYNADQDYMIEMLDDLQGHWDKGVQFNRTYYSELTSCFDKWNDTMLAKSQ